MMRYFIFYIVILFGFLQAEIVLPVQKGWTLIGVPQDMKDLSSFSDENIELIWAYDAIEQKWLAYSPHTDTSQTLSTKNIATLKELKSYQGFWILSSKDWVLTFERSDEESVESKTLELYSGWNLVSLPIDMRVSPLLFGSDSVWKYSEANEWESFGIDADNEDVQTLSTISNSNGIWVYSDSDKSIELSEASSRLDTFDSNETMISYIREMVLNNQRLVYGCFHIAINSVAIDINVAEVADDTDGTTGATSSVTDTTTTNIQEEGVDESDIVKHDGNHIFYVSKTEKKIHITSFVNLASGNFTPISSIDLPSDMYPNSIYLNNNILVLLYNSAYNYGYSNSKSTIEFYDVSDVSSVSKLKSISVDGRYINSRLIGEKLYFMSSFYPHIEVEYPKIYLDIDCSSIDTWSYSSSECYGAYYEYVAYTNDYVRYRYDYTKPTIKSEYLVPNLYVDSVSKSSLLTPQSFYAPIKLDQRSNITTITELNISNQSVSDSISYLGDSSEEYMSQRSLYLVSKSYPYYFDFNSYKYQSTIYKFSLSPLSYDAKGVVEGHTLNQFSLSEHNETLRVATTSGFSWSGTGTNNSVYMLQDINETLSTVGEIDGLGKENETIRAVRFIADKGYVVTFRQTDPFYTLDLSDPENPLKVGELNVTGFSEYIHPVNDTQLLSIGRDADENGVTGGLQLELFDVSDFANPTILDKKVIGDRSYYSEAEYDHRAFTFRDSDSLFGFPYRTYYEYNQNTFAYYTLQDSNITLLGDMTINIDSYYSSWQSRGIFFDYNSERYVIFFSNGKFISQKVD